MATVNAKVDVWAFISEAGELRWWHCPVIAGTAVASPQFPGLYQLSFTFPGDLRSNPDDTITLRIVVDDKHFDFPVDFIP